MPAQYRCDACRAVLHHLNYTLQLKKSRQLKEWEYTELFEEVCDSSFQGYGIQLVNGKNALSGPGLTTDQQVAGSSAAGAINIGGEKWSKFLGETCRSIVFDHFGESQLYTRFRQVGALSRDMCSEMPHCPKETTIRRGMSGKSGKSAATGNNARTSTVNASHAKSQTKEVPGSIHEQTVDSNQSFDVQIFLQALAVSHGLDSDSYLLPRTHSQWEKLMVNIAGQISNRSVVDV